MTSPSPLERIAGPGNVLAKEPPDAKEFAGLVRSALARLKDAERNELAGQQVRPRLQRRSRPVSSGAPASRIPGIEAVDCFSGAARHCWPGARSLASLSKCHD